jgi:predicted amidohydrolase
MPRLAGAEEFCKDDLPTIRLIGSVFARNLVMRTTAKISLVHPRNWERSWAQAWPVHFADEDPDERSQLDEAEAFIARAAAAGAEYLLFPEMYPGPRSLSDQAFTAEEVKIRMCSAAKKHGIWVFYNGTSALEEGGGQNTCFAVSPAGNVATSYSKMIPACGEQSIPGKDPVVIDCDGLRVGIVICWEMWFPEITRMVAALGADVIFAPTGGVIYELTSSWKTILFARAAENTVFTATCVNLFGVEDGMCVVYSPEGLVAERTGAGILNAELDLVRLRYLRETDERLIVPKPYRVIPGLFRALTPAVVERYAEVMAGRIGKQ